MRLLERLAYLTQHHPHDHEADDHDHHGPQREGCGANNFNKESSSVETDCRTVVPRRHSGLFKFRRSTTEESITEGVRQVRFDLDDISRHDSVFDKYFQQEEDDVEAIRLWESQWYSPQEIKDMKMDCARDVATFLRANNNIQLAQTLATCQSIAYEESLAETRHHLVAQLCPVVGIAHLCCKTFGAALKERRRTILMDVQQAQQRGRRKSSSGHPHHHHHHHHHHVSVDTDLCQAFLVCRASEHISQPCGRLAGWLAQAVVLDLKEEDHGDFCERVVM